MTHPLAHASAHALRHASGAVPSAVTFEDGIHLDFAAARYYTKVPGAAPVAAAFTTIFAFTGDNLSKYRGASGLLIPSVTNTPRIEYDAGGAVRGLLIEGSRINLALHSEDYTAHATLGLNAIGANAIVSPDGAVTAELLSEDTSTGAHRVRQALDVTIGANATYTMSHFVKAKERTFCSLRLADSTFASDVNASFNLSTGALISVSHTGVGSGEAATITPYANGWYRITLTGALNGGFTAARPLLELNNAASNPSYTGDGTSGLYAWGEQFELGAFPSSYIPTTAASVTRAGEVATRTVGAEFTKNVAETTIVNFAPEFTPGAATGLNVLWAVDANGILASFNNNNNQASMFDGTNTAVSNVAALAAGTFAKFGTAYDGGGMSAVMNGGTPGTAAFDGTMGAAATVNLGSNAAGASPFFGWIKRLDAYPSRKSNSEVQARTA